MKDLYDHQKAYLEALNRQKEPFHALVAIPTGGGKTTVAIKYALTMLQNDNSKKVLWVAHTTALLDQAYDMFESEINENRELYSNLEDHFAFIYSEGQHCSLKLHDSSKIIFATFQSLGNHYDLERIIGNNTLIVVDEAHHLVARTFFGAISKYASDKTVIGLTATPIRADTEEIRRLQEFFNTDLGCKVSLLDLIEKHIVVRPNFIVERSVGWDNKSIFEYYDKNCMRFNKTVIVVKSIDAANEIYSMFKANLGKYALAIGSGVTDEVILSDFMRSRSYGASMAYKSDRDFCRDWFSKQDLEGIQVFCMHNDRRFPDLELCGFYYCRARSVLICVNMLDEGIDVPDIDTVILADGADSPIKITQRVGRALRGAEGKDSANIVSLCKTAGADAVIWQMPSLSYLLYEKRWRELLENETEIPVENLVNFAKLYMTNKKSDQNADQDTFNSVLNSVVVGCFTLPNKDSLVSKIIPATFLECSFYQTENDEWNLPALLLSDKYQSISGMSQEDLYGLKNDGWHFAMFNDELFRDVLDYAKMLDNVYLKLRDVLSLKTDSRDKVLDVIRNVLPDENNLLGPALKKYVSFFAGSKEDTIKLIEEDCLYYIKQNSYH